jgi:hypothetical protein
VVEFSLLISLLISLRVSAIVFFTYSLPKQAVNSVAQDMFKNSSIAGMERN